MKKIIAVLAVLLLMVPAFAFADELEDLQKRIEKLEKKVKRSSGKSAINWSGDFQFRYDALSATVPTYLQFNPANFGAPYVVTGHDVENKDLMTNRLGLNMKARATQDITVTARLLMYKAWGHQTTPANYYFADRMMVFDGNTSHVPQDSILRVDRAYASWSGIGGQPVWFSIGRRPSTGGVPTHFRRNQEKSGASGTPGILVDYAFDGLVLGVAPDMAALPGAYFKFCYGKGFDAGIQPTSSSLDDVTMIGLDLAAYSTDNLHIELQYNKAFDIFAFPESQTYSFGLSNSIVNNTNLGDIEQLGLVVMSKMGPLSVFASAAMSKTHPNDNLYTIQYDSDDDGSLDASMPVAGLLYTAPGMGGVKEDKTGNAIYVGARYDMDSIGAKFGVEYNKGSEDWITFTPAADDMWTSKLATRGTVVELYAIKELNQKAVSRNGKAYFRLGYQKYEFDYTGSGNWVGAPMDINAVTTFPQMMTPLEDAEDIYLTFNTEF